MTADAQSLAHRASLDNARDFWARQASLLTWHKQPSETIRHSTRQLRNGVSHPSWSWFPDGEINTSFNCIDRHVKAGHGHDIALIWDSPVSGQQEKYSYTNLLDAVETFAGVLAEEGIQKGDVVLMYMPMIPATLIGLLATTRLGAIHSVVFGGFASPSLAQRIEGCQPKAILTASCGIEGAKGPISYRPLVLDAIEQSKHKPDKVIIWQREQCRWTPLNPSIGERHWKKLVRSAKSRNVKGPVVPVASDDPVYLIYTSGTTGLPKGVQRETAGHLVGLNFMIRYCFGVGRGDVMFTASDIGWVGATTILFEGKPVGSPNAGTFWRIIQEHRVNVLFTAPTALRAIRKDDPDNTFFETTGRNGGLKHFKALFLAGERSEPSIVTMYQNLLDAYSPGALVIDNWWSSESGSPITALALNPSLATKSDLTRVPKVKPGAAGKPMPGFDVRVVDDNGIEQSRGTMGNIVLGLPLAPTGMTTLWKDPERFYRGYLERFGGKFVDTGDAGMIDEDGYVHVMSRSDDVINVAAHRFSTGAIEQAITSHPHVAEACVVGIPDSLKGHKPFAFVTLSSDTVKVDSHLLDQMQALIKNQIGAIASLGGMLVAKGIIPKTRSGKTLRRVLRELLENATRGEFDKDVQIPATIEDPSIVDAARQKIRDYFETSRGLSEPGEPRAKI